MYLLPYHSGGQKFKFSFMGWSQGVSREDHSGNSVESLCSCCLQFLEHVCMLWPMATQRWLSNISISPQVPNLYICFHIDWCSCSISAKTVDQWEVSPSCNDVSTRFWQQEVDSFERPLFCKPWSGMAIRVHNCPLQASWCRAAIGYDGCLYFNAANVLFPFPMIN